MMRTWRNWTPGDIRKLKAMAGKYPLDKIALELGRRPSAVASKAHEIRVFLKVHQNRPASTDPGPAGMDLTG
jgi:hypothetical protein